MYSHKIKGLNMLLLLEHSFGFLTISFPRTHWSIGSFIDFRLVNKKLEILQAYLILCRSYMIVNNYSHFMNIKVAFRIWNSYYAFRFDMLFCMYYKMLMYYKNNLSLINLNLQKYTIIVGHATSKSINHKCYLKAHFVTHI